MLQKNEGWWWRGCHIRANLDWRNQAKETCFDPFVYHQHQRGSDRKTKNLCLEVERETKSVPIDVWGTFEK